MPTRRKTIAQQNHWRAAAARWRREKTRHRRRDALQGRHSFGFRTFLRHGHSKAECGPIPVPVVLRPNAAAVGLDDGARDGEAHAHAVRLRREERIEYLTQFLRRDAVTGVADTESDKP